MNSLASPPRRRAALFAPISLAVLASLAAAQTPEQLTQIQSALPAEAAPAEKPRKVLLFTATLGFRHSSIPVGVAALTQLGEKTRAFSVTHSEDIAMFEKDVLEKFDAVILLNTTGELFTPPLPESAPADAVKAAAEREARLKASLKQFVESGKGLVGIHAATDTFYKWPWYGETIGGYFDGHPWNADHDVVIRLDDPQHPLAKALGVDSLSFKEEIYQHREPYSRQGQRVLMSLDTIRTNMKRDGIKRTDNDFGVSWVRTAGRGRVFYCALGHNEHIYWNPAVLRHYLAGIQFAIGDLKVETAPLPKPAAGEKPPGK